jgi:hypothetical protein
MAGYRRPPVRALKITGAMLGATPFAIEFYQRWRGFGAAIGLVIGGCLGWIVAWWAARRLFD